MGVTVDMHLSTYANNFVLDTCKSDFALNQHDKLLCNDGIIWNTCEIPQHTLLKKDLWEQMDGLSTLLLLSLLPACFAALLCVLQNPATVCSPFKVIQLPFEVWLKTTRKSHLSLCKIKVCFTVLHVNRFIVLCVCFQCFAVRSLGWVEMAEEDLAPGKSSVAVNNCIRQLSYCKNDIRDTVGIWGEVRKRVWLWI